MNESGKYQVFKEKLQGICNENNLSYSIQNKKYPFTLTIKPISGMDGQIDMLEAMGDRGEVGEGSGTGYISPDASLVFSFTDGNLVYKISETFTISDALFSKIKNLFKKMHDMWMMYFFRDVLENSPSAAAAVADMADETAGDDEEYTEDENGAEQ